MRCQRETEGILIPLPLSARDEVAALAGHEAGGAALRAPVRVALPLQGQPAAVLAPRGAHERPELPEARQARPGAKGALRLPERLGQELVHLGLGLPPAGLALKLQAPGELP